MDKQEFLVFWAEIFGDIEQWMQEAYTDRMHVLRIELACRFAATGSSHQDALKTVLGVEEEYWRQIEERRKAGNLDI